MGKRIQAIGKYTMGGQTLGKGNFARVELAMHEVTKCKVAVKIINTRKITEDYVRNNLYREAKILSQLKHPNIIKFYESLKATTLYCLVTEYVSGGELLTYLKTFPESRLPEAESRPYVRQIVSALHYMHERGVVHRDLKMENILLDEKKRNIKIVDFGLSNYLCEDCKLRTHCGSPEYAAPELFLSEAEYGSEIDIWSLGIIMYVMVVGKLPFSSPYHDHARRQRLLNQINKGITAKHERDMEHLASDCRQLIRQMIEPNPTLRLPLQEIEINSWFTSAGTYPFTPYNPPPRDPSLRSQSESSSVSNISSVGTEEIVIMELASMVDMSREEVERCVHEYSSNELSAMFNMLLENKRKEKGVYEDDHTCRRDELLRYERAKQCAREKWRTLRKNLKESAKLFKEALKERENQHRLMMESADTPRSEVTPERRKTTTRMDHLLSISAVDPIPRRQHDTLKNEDYEEQTGQIQDRFSCPVTPARSEEIEIPSQSQDASTADVNGNGRCVRPTSLELHRMSQVSVISRPPTKPKKSKKRVLNPLGIYIAPKTSLFPPKRTPFTASSPTSPSHHCHSHRRPSTSRRHRPSGDDPFFDPSQTPSLRRDSSIMTSSVPSASALKQRVDATSSGLGDTAWNTPTEAQRERYAHLSTDLLGTSPTAHDSEAKVVAQKLYRDELLDQARKQAQILAAKGPAPRATAEDLIATPAATPVQQHPDQDSHYIVPRHWPRDVDDVVRTTTSETSEGSANNTSCRTSACPGGRSDSTCNSSQFSALSATIQPYKCSTLKSASDTSVFHEMNGAIPGIIASDSRLVVADRMK